VLAAACLLAAGPVGAASRPKDLWATVNGCDTKAHPNMMSLRASMPGDGDATKMYMRFAAQYFNRDKQLWYDVAGTDGTSKWLYVGSGRKAWVQMGYTFGFKPLKSPRTYVLRGVVDFEWRKSRRVVRRLHLNTKGGRGATKGADPPGFSSGLCEIR
jgi:hypothetical protein